MLPGLQASAGFMSGGGVGSSIILVGQKKGVITAITPTAVSLTDLTGGSDTQPSAGDFVLVGLAGVRSQDYDMEVTTGYTQIAELYENSTHDSNLVLAYKVMGGSPDTTVTLAGNITTVASMAYAIKVYRGVNATPMDVAATTASGIASGNPNPAAITPITAGALIVACGGGGWDNAQAGGVFTSPDMDGMLSEFAPDSTYNCSVGMAVKVWPGGSFDPGAWSGGAVNAGNTWTAITCALRPA